MFDNIRRNSIIKKINNKSYSSYGEARNKINKSFPNDEELLELAIISYSDSPNYLTSDEKIKLFLKYRDKQNFKITNYLSIEEYKKAYELDKTIISYLPEKIKNDIIDKVKYKYEFDKNDEYCKMGIDIFLELPFDKQFELYYQSTMIRKAPCNIDPQLIYKYCEYLKNGYQNKGDYLKYIKEFATEINFSKLKSEIKNNILKLDNNYFRILSKEEKQNILNNNSYFFEIIKKFDMEVTPINKKGKSKMFALLGENKEQEAYNEEINQCKNVSLDYKIGNGRLYPGIEGIWDFTKIYMNDYNKFAEFAEFNPQMLYIMNCSNLNYARAKLHVEYYKKTTNNLPNRDEFNKIFDEFLNMFRKDYNYEIIRRDSLAFGKVLFNKNIMNKCDPKIIYEYLKDTGNREKLLLIIEKTYGTKAKEILDKRSEITVNEIPNFDIFDSKIIDKLGPGLIHNILSYSGNCGLVVAEMARNEELLNKYIEFSRFSRNLFTDESIDMERKLLAFYDMYTNFESFDISSFTDLQKKNLLLYISDKYIANGGENYYLNISSLEELEKYETDRNKKIDEVVDYCNNLTTLKNLIFFRYFGLKLDNQRNFSKNNLDMGKILYRYNSSKFANTELVINSNEFTTQELDMLKLVNIINNIDSIDTLKKLYNRVKEENDILNIDDFRSIIVKMDKYYCQKMQFSLNTAESFDEMVSNKVPGISKKEEDGITIYCLDGADFKMLVHNPGANNETGISEEAYDTKKQWEIFEDGSSTISCCLIEPALTDIYNFGNVCLGFCNFDYRQIAGMSNVDAQSSHTKRMSNPDFQYGMVSYELPDELARRTAAQIENTAGEFKDISHPYNEVTLYRRYVDTSKIKGLSNGGRLMPDYIVCYDYSKINEAKEFSKRFSKDGTPLPIVYINTKEYVRYNNKSSRAYEGYNQNQYEQEQSEFIKKITNDLNSNEKLESAGRSR